MLTNVSIYEMALDSQRVEFSTGWSLLRASGAGMTFNPRTSFLSAPATAVAHLLRNFPILL